MGELEAVKWAFVGDDYILGLCELLVLVAGERDILEVQHSIDSILIITTS